MTRRHEFARPPTPRLSRLTPEPAREQADAAKQRGRLESTRPPPVVVNHRCVRRGGCTGKRKGFLFMQKSRNHPPNPASTEQRVLADSEPSQTATLSALRLRLLALKYQFWWVYELLLELCNYLDRTRTLISHRARPLIDTGHLWGTDRHGEVITCRSEEHTS